MFMLSWFPLRLPFALWHFQYKRTPIPEGTVLIGTIEIIWIGFPSIILMFMAIPSFSLIIFNGRGSISNNYH